MMKYLTLLAMFLLYSCQWSPAFASIAPADAKQYQRELTRNSRAIFGIDAPVSLFAAQIHQESRWQVNAKSWAGAQGLAQFMPSTAEWMTEIYPQSLGDNQPFNPSWSLRALVQYDYWLYKRITNTASDCDRWAFTLSAYNGGLGWVNRDRNQASSLSQNSAYYWDVVEAINAGRSVANFKENRGYPKQIIYRWQPLYIADGWGLGVCDD